MKTCPKCNAQLADDVLFCNECGTRLDAAQPAAGSVAPATPAAPKAPLNSGKIKKFAIFGGIGVAAIIVIVILFAFIGANSGPEAAVKGFMNAYKKGDYKTLVNYFVPKDAQEEYFTKAYGDDDDEEIEASTVTDALTDYAETLWKGVKKKGKVNVTYEIKNLENINKLKKHKSTMKDIGISDLDDFCDKILSRFEYVGADLDKVKEAYLCKLEYKVELGGKKVLKEDGLIAIYKYGGKYLLYGDLPDVTDLYYEIRSNEKLNDKYEDMLDDIDELEDEYDYDFINYMW